MVEPDKHSRTNRRTYLKSSLSAVALASAAGCLGGSGGGGDTLKFGYTSSLSGPTAVLGKQYHTGFQIWRDHVNENGGILNKEVELVHYDDESNPERARELANRLASQDNVDFLFGPYGSPNNYSASLVSQQNQIPMVSGASSDPEIFSRGLEYYYSTLSKTTKYGKSFPEFLASLDWGSFDMDEPSTAATLRADAAYTSTLGKALTQNLEDQGFEVAYEQEYPTDQNDFSSILSELSNADPDVLCVCGFPADEARFAEQAQQAGLNVDIHYQNYSSQTVIVDTLGDQVNYMMNGAWWDRRYDYNRVDTYVEMWNQRKDSVAEMPLSYATAAGMVFEKAIEEASSTNADDVNQALKSLDIETPLGRTQFHETGWNRHQYKNEAVRQWQNQEMTLLYPEKFATGDVWLPTPNWGNRDSSPE
ncbi:amino acid ABC transporter substrate-binding protein [Natrinema sp. 1APR25-10V2]|uniref:amino acid ABC transporter substrate-binding protein n=1 Tax=Natrinema sp. 1APR25-10V2 TaxID=2951081 RepID=UPI0028746275|nr:amino acid ABC transporter substrate-binding protein [Natrinema sp. 1APR25-10V2]MDS0476957.1 amino acid ABC transporter substrate-binding protein [Natrinema sp. 1APR25-10V2]